MGGYIVGADARQIEAHSHAEARLGSWLGHFRSLEAHRELFWFALAVTLDFCLLHCWGWVSDSEITVIDGFIVDPFHLFFD